jgi:hypothetical protein
MDWKRRSELICGLITGVLGIGVTVETMYVTQLTGQMLHEPPPMLATFLSCLVLYLLPTFLVAIGAYAHAAKRRLWGRLLLITASVFLTVWFFLSLVGLVWSRWVLLSWLIVLLTAFAMFTSIISFLVRRER